MAGIIEKLTLIIGVVLVAASAVGVDNGPLLAMIGATGLVIELALQGTLSHLASGILILLTRPFDVGDGVDAGGVFGKVEAMNLVSTTILTFDNQVMLVPNNQIWNSVITNVTGKATRLAIFLLCEIKSRQTYLSVTDLHANECALSSFRDVMDRQVRCTREVGVRIGYVGVGTEIKQRMHAAVLRCAKFHREMNFKVLQDNAGVCWRFLNAGEHENQWNTVGGGSNGLCLRRRGQREFVGAVDFDGSFVVLDASDHGLGGSADDLDGYPLRAVDCVGDGGRARL
ncbi:MAG: mechanosensitive ion channel [Planctomycetales bacterium]|nr:mechanosensitive ion channel [Planctomycetales bacterium]